jgi:hypothetical protein
MVLIKSVCVKYPKLRLLGSSLAKTGDEIKSQDENSAQETKRGSSTLTGVSPPVFAFALPWVLRLLLFSKSSCQNKVLQNLWSDDTQFQKKKRKAVLNFTHFLDTLKLGMKQGLQGQTQAQRHEVKNDKNSPSEMDI